MKRRKLPAIDSINELAKFWASHDLADFQDQLEEVGEPVFVGFIPIKVRLRPDDAEILQQIARAKGVSREELVREWVLQRLARRKTGAQKRSSETRPARLTKK